ncbi:aminotransferase DegT [Spongiactinospora gelatinilytica]|uniref:Aminotransferase DegT n=1 Tax=Spongiactinospora gelatinilytica TaxID=2666298 RepID=A0A2W2I346_9ACTN|nr:aminotransferase DegT [Spongiactinospora gelatinilytica]
MRSLLRAVLPRLREHVAADGRRTAGACRVTQSHVRELEAELAEAFGVPYAVAVSSGTAALHTALVAAGIGPGDEVAVPAACVPMTVAAITYTGARPVLIDGTGHQITPATRAVMAVHLAGRCTDLPNLADFAAAHGLRLIEDACQAQGSEYANRLAGSYGDVGCFSLKDGKILSAGEGGYLLTHDADLAEQARRFRTHLSVDHPRAGPRFGHNYRMPELIAAQARQALLEFPTKLAQRKAQATLLMKLVEGTPRVRPMHPPPHENWNGYSALFHLDLPRPRDFCAHLAEAGVPNSIGTYGLISADRLPAMAAYKPARCPQAAKFLDHTLAVVLSEQDDDDRIRHLAHTITKEARSWN